LSGAERIFSVLDIEPDVLEVSDPVDLVDSKGQLIFKDVSFSYVRGRPVLSDISFETKPGEKLALFGPTGAGKSTIINLVGRFYDPDEGMITVDGENLRDISFRSLRNTVSIVLQEPFLFSGTIEYNLKFGRPEATDEEMFRVARLLGIHDTISKFRGKYGTEIMERGSNLSFGQQQLICLGRAILADPRILLFDEATSSVDPYTESMIQNALREELVNRTVIIITHRVSTVRDADRIILLNEGLIEDIGTHDDLIERSFLYRKLCEIQLVETT
jgi:ATP-binding cassette subfamily B protein